MTSICYVCNGSLGSGPLNNSQVDSGLVDGSIGTTPCGHLFHIFCISRWWKSQSHLNQGRNIRNFNDTTESANNNDNCFTTTSISRWFCPLCNKLLAKPEVFEIYLSTVDDPDDDDKKKELKVLRERVDELKKKNEFLHDTLNEQNAVMANWRFRLRPRFKK